MDKKEKPSILTFHGKELLEASGLTYMDIEKRCGREALQYRTVYSFFELNEGKAKIETAAQIALAVGTSLDRLYTPKGSAWVSASSTSTPSDEKVTESDLQIIFAHLDKDALSKLSLALIKSGHDPLAELCNQYAVAMNAENPAESEGAENE